MVNTLTELLKQKYTSSLTKRIELDEQFFLEAKNFPNEVLDFSSYPNLEQIISQGKGGIKSLNVSRNRNLKELTFLNNKLTRLDLSRNTKLEKIDISNNKISGKLDLGECPGLKVIICRNNY